MKVLLLVIALTLLLLSRPRAVRFPRAVARMRSRERNGAGTLSAEMEPVVSAIRAGEVARVSAIARSKCTARSHSWPNERMWALDGVLFSVGCTHKRCFLGALGSWWGAPRWTPDTDLWALAAVHAISCATSHFEPRTYHRYFSPNTNRPHSIILGAFATAGVMELIFMVTTLNGIGANLQVVIYDPPSEHQVST